ncbi:MAG: SDR family oxidoreductase [Sphingomonadaceae bacterium]|nr:SDR family oxidoreductase [Sphingomonadaceae bacterium]
MKLALVTGGCRRLGAAIARRLAEDGYALALHASQNPDVEEALREKLEASGAQWHGFAADLSDGAAAEQLLPRVTGHFGTAPTLLVNSAAQFGDDRLADAAMDFLLEHYAVNCAAPVLLSKAFTAQTGQGAIVNILDQRIANPHGDQLGYSLSKIALSGLTAILARELAPSIRVNAVAPGLTIPTQDYSDGQLEKVRCAMPLEILPEPAQVADAVAWLASAGAVTGQTIFVDGGAHLEAFDRDFVRLD